MGTMYARAKINIKDTQKEGIEYPTRVAMVIDTSDRRPRRHPENRPRTIPSHIVAALARPTSTRGVDSRGAITPATADPPFSYVIVVPTFPCNKLAKYTKDRV